MMAQGAGSLTGYFGLLYIDLPEFALAILGGVIIGRVAWQRWWQRSLLFSGTMFGIPYLLLAFDSFTRSLIVKAGAGHLLGLVLQDSLLLPLALGGAWVASRGRCRRVARIASSHCQKCGYDLKGNVSGVCPECGQTH